MKNEKQPLENDVIPNEDSFLDALASAIVAFARSQYEQEKIENEHTLS